jgi:lipopolysaccharide transport system ATP-binding protein
MSSFIKIENLSKQYRLGASSSGPDRSLREAVGDLARWPGRQVRKLFSGPATTASTRPTRETIWALKDVSFEVGAGEVVGIIGRNGAGKSTLLKIVSRITDPTEGLVRLKGRVGSLLEVGTGFHPELSGRENIYLNGAILSMTRREIRSKFDEIVAFAGIETFLDTPVKHYSSGMYIRLAFAVAAHLESEILLIDEVLAVGDMEFQKRCLGKMDSVARSGRTVLFVSHNLAAIQHLCHRLVLLSHGQVQRVGTCTEVVGEYLNSSAAGTSSGETALSSFRPPGFIPVIQEVVLRDSKGRAADYICSGDSLTIEIRYDSPVTLHNPILSILVETTLGERLFYLLTLSQHGPISTLPQRGVATCHVPELPLMPGSYKLSIFCAEYGQEKDMDSLERAVTLNVEAGNFFGTGILPLVRTGRFLVHANWDFAESGVA